MPDTIDISILGDKKLERKLARLDLALQRKYVRQSMRRAMRPVKDRAKSLVPVDTGALRKSIKQKSSSKRGISRARVVTGTRLDLGISPTATGYYPAAIEYGTRDKAPESFLRRAMTELKDSTLTKFGDFLDRYIRGSR